MHLLKKLLLVWRTVVYLRWEQLVYRPIRLVQFRLYRALPFLTRRWMPERIVSPAISSQFLTSFRQIFAEQFAHWSMPLDEVAKRLSDLKEDRFTFLNQTLSLPEPDWNQRYVGHLWNYQLHYQDYVVWAARAWVEQGDEAAWQRARRLMESWMAQARIGVSDGWDAYPTSLRVVHWLYAYSLVAEHETDTAFLARWRASIYGQFDFLSSHLETHLLANHLFKNVKALVIGGLFWADDQRGQRWLRTGERLLARELDEQICADGGHYERSPMYHAQTLGDTLECYALLKAAGRPCADESMRQRLLGMADFLAVMSYNDDKLALFNDAANTFETRPHPLLESAKRVGGKHNDSPQTTFPQSGYYSWQSADAREKIIIDAGEPSVSYNTAHAHCDMLSYELRLNDQPFIVDSGLHGYGGDKFREYCRSTRAHNTIMFNHHEQSELWGTFRMARRARLRSAKAESRTDQWRFEAEYEDYSASGTFYRREILRQSDQRWEIRDQVLLHEQQAPDALIQSFIHLHPRVKATKEQQGIVCQTAEGRFLIEPFGFAGYDLQAGVSVPQVQGWYFPDFGVAQPSVVITLWQKLEAYDQAEGLGYRIQAC